MSIRHLEFFFHPRSIALIGASKEPSSVGAVLASNLFHSGFDGPILPVNPKHGSIQGVLAYPDVASLPLTPDLAVIATPPHTVPGIIAELGARGTRAAVVVTAGLGEGEDAEGRQLQQAMLDASRPHRLRIVGPNCLGILVPGIGLNASFSHISPLKGDIAFIAQSGAMVGAVLDWATARGVGFSHLVSLGDMPDVDFGDLLDYLALEARARAILLYVESVTHARKFMSAARAAARSWPIIVIKGGRHAEGARAAASHTGALAGADAVYDAAFRRAGMLRVRRMEELFEGVQTLARAPAPAGDRLAILTNGGGFGVLAVDELMEHGGRLAELSGATLERLDAVLPPTWSRANPVDIIGDAPRERYAQSMGALLEDPAIDALLVLNAPAAVASGAEAARAVLEALSDRKRTVFTSWVGGAATAEARQLFSEAGIPTYETPDQAVRAFMHLVRYRQNQALMKETPPSVPEEFEAPDTARVRTVVERVLAQGRAWLSEAEAKQVLTAYAIPVVETRTAATPEEAAAVAAEFGGSVVLKILSPDIAHKSDVGGVRLALATPEAVRAAGTAMLEQVRALRPEATLTGFTVQRMVGPSGGHELIVGMAEDAQFGPVLLFGQGGTAVEVVGDKALALPPLNLNLARDLMARTRIFKLLQGYRDRPAANLDAIALTLVKVSHLVADVPELAELDINPLRADEREVVALDARMRVAKASQPGSARLAIRPYPKELEELVTLPDGRRLLLRPVRPEDEPAFRTTFARLSAREVWLRFFSMSRTLSHDLGVLLTQIDYDRQMAFALTDLAGDGEPKIYGVVRLSADPDNRTAEFAILVTEEVTGLGLGKFLVRRLIDYARSRGIGELFGDVLRENDRMRALCRSFGFGETPNPEGQGFLTVTLTL